MIDRERLADLAEAMFSTDDRGRLVGDAPHLHIIRTPLDVICRFHSEVSDEIADAMLAIACCPRGRADRWAQDYAEYARMLSSAGPLKRLRAGLLYGFPVRQGSAGSAVAVGQGNADLLLGGLDEWRSDVRSGQPMMAVLEGGRAVSVCASVVASRSAHCAGVETLPGYRGRGLAAGAVAAWAMAVRLAGAEPYYTTTFDNVASQCVAKRLDLRCLGSEFAIRCEDC